MAFHPFRHFRKHQKVYLAGLTIMTMIIFVFSFGAADPIQTALRWIGGRSRGDEVIALYGKKIYEFDLERVRKYRQLANEFVFNYGGHPFSFTSLLNRAVGDLERKYGPDRKAAPNEEPRNPVQDALQSMSFSTQLSLAMPGDRRMETLFQGLKTIQDKLKEKQDDTEQTRAIDAIATRMAMQMLVLDPKRRPTDYYFGGTPRYDDLLDFLVWKHQADKLGISLTPADVCREVNRAWGNREWITPDEKFDDNRWVQEFLRTSNKIHKDLTSRDLLSALTDEYRVALAKQAILGVGSGYRYYRDQIDDVHRGPSAVTPDEFFAYYQKQRTTLFVSMLPIPVDSFVSKVEGKPSEEDLNNLYEAYKERELSSAQREPGFKEPRRIKVQYFSYSADSPAYRQAADKLMAAMEPLTLWSELAGGTAGGGPAGWAMRFAAPMNLDTAIAAKYEDYRREENNRVAFNHFGVGFDLNNRAVTDVQAPVAALGHLMGSIGAGGSPLAAPVAWLGVRQLEEQATLKAYASKVMASAGSSPLAAVTLPIGFLHTARPLDAVREEMRQRVSKDLAKAMIFLQFGSEGSTDGNFEKEMLKLVGKPGLQSYIDKVVKEHGLPHYHAMSKAQTRQEILDNPDPELKALRDAYDDLPPAFGQKRPDFVSALFEGDKPLFSPTSKFTSKGKDETFLFWRSQDIKAHVRQFSDVRADVEKAWYFEQARKLARDKARQINEELKQQHLNPSDAVKFLREQKQGLVFELSGVAHLVSPALRLPGHRFRPEDFQPYQPPKDRIAYPPADFVDELLELTEPGASRVLADQPVKHFYVAVLMEKPSVPERREFYEIYSVPGKDNRLWMQMMQERQRTYSQKLMDQLRAEATPQLRDGNYDVPDAIRTRFDSGSGDSGE